MRGFAIAKIYVVIKNNKYKHMKYISIILILNFLFLSEINGQSGTLDAYFESMFSASYKNTVNVLSSLKNTSPNSVKTKLAFANYYLVMFETTGELEKYNILCNKEAGYVNTVLSKKKNLTPDDVFDMISAKALLLKIQFRQKKIIKAVNGLRTIIKYFEYATEHEEHLKMKLISGMYNYYIENAKDDYPAAYPILLFFPEGDKAKGLRMLKECTKEKDKTVQIRSHLYLANIYRRDEKNFEQSEYWFQQLMSKYPSNVFWLSDYILMLREYEKHEKAEIQKNKLVKILQESDQLTEEQIQYLKTI